MASPASLFTVPAQNAVSRKVLRLCLIIYEDNWDQLVMSAAGNSTGRRVCEGGPCAEPEVQKVEVAGPRPWNKEAAGLRPETAFLSPNLGSFQDITVDSRVRQTQGARDIWGLCPVMVP